MYEMDNLYWLDCRIEWVYETNERMKRVHEKYVKSKSMQPNHICWGSNQWEMTKEPYLTGDLNGWFPTTVGQDDGLDHSSNDWL